jgi:predicted acetyltransferase
MSSAHRVELVAATPADSALLDNLLQLYIHDMSEFFAVELDREGRYRYDKLPMYWSQPASHHAFMIRCDGETAGLALVTRGSVASTDPAILDLNEFFVLRSLRRLNVGHRAAFQLWDRLRGDWIVRVSERNRLALKFWERTIRAYTGGRFSTMKFAGEAHLFRAHLFSSEPHTAAMQDKIAKP